MILLLLAAQAVSAAPAPAPTRFSILQPVGSEPCVRRGKDGKDKSSPEDIVVCGKPLPSQALPYPDEVVLDEPRPSNPYMTGTGALALETTPCAGRSGGCGVGIDLLGMATAAVRLAQKAVAPGSCCEEAGEGTNPVLLARDAVHGAGKALRKKPDTSRRVPILMDERPVDTAGKVLP